MIKKTNLWHAVQSGILGSLMCSRFHLPFQFEKSMMMLIQKRSILDIQN